MSRSKYEKKIEDHAYVLLVSFVFRGGFDKQNHICVFIWIMLVFFFLEKKNKRVERTDGSDPFNDVLKMRVLALLMSECMRETSRSIQSPMPRRLSISQKNVPRGRLQ